MADLDAPSNGLEASQEQAIDLDEVGDGSPDIDLIVSTTLDQLNEDTDPTMLEDYEEDSVGAEEMEDGSPLFVSPGVTPTPTDVGEALDPEVVEWDGIAVVVPLVQNRWEYRRYEDPAQLNEIVEEYNDGGLVEYLVQLDDEREEVVSQASMVSYLNLPSPLSPRD